MEEHLVTSLATKESPKKGNGRSGSHPACTSEVGEARR